MWNEAKIVFYVLLVYGFIVRRKWLINYFKNWWEIMKIAWNQPNEIINRKKKE